MVSAKPVISQSAGSPDYAGTITVTPAIEHLRGAVRAFLDTFADVSVDAKNVRLTEERKAALAELRKAME